MPGFGNVPTSWSGIPFEVSVRFVGEQLQVEVACAFTEAEELKVFVE